MPVSIAPDVEELLRQQTETGPYASTDDVLRAALRLLRERDADHQRRLEELRAEIAIGLADIEQGNVAEWDVEALIEECHREAVASPVVA